ncbi:hypothetical protein DIPPA_24723 [Diplonema papillatum]|nr:hypothetical protein DIPPA_32147 [Diplonema papillatum]KAJ9435734.1 hypothetical protein DIPPA_24723 [Diplonema papillatum]
MHESEPLALTELGFAGEVCPCCGAVVATRGELEHHSAMHRAEVAARAWGNICGTCIRYMEAGLRAHAAGALVLLAIKKDPPGPPGCDVLMGSQRPEADPPHPGEHKDPGSDAPMGEAQGPGPGAENPAKRLKTSGD